MRLLNAGRSVQEIARQLDLGVGTGKPISPGPIALWARAIGRKRCSVPGLSWTAPRQKSSDEKWADEAGDASFLSIAVSRTFMVTVRNPASETV